MDILVQPLNRVIRFEPGANLLQALQAAQVPMSYSCMAGRCGTCRCLNVGDAVKVSGPLGWAYLRRKHEGPMLCVAGGTGLAPILSILRGAVAQGMKNPIHLYFGVRSPRDVYGLHWLEQLQRDYPALKVHVVVTSCGNAATQRCGRVTDAIEQDHGDLSGWRAYLCGSPPMVEAATVVARRKGIAVAHVHADAFYAQRT